MGKPNTLICSLAIVAGALSAFAAHAELYLTASHQFVSSQQAPNGLYDTQVNLTLTNSGTESLTSVTLSLGPVVSTTIALPGMNAGNSASLTSLPVGATSTVLWQFKTMLPADALPPELLLLNGTGLDASGAIQSLAVVSTPTAP